MANYKYNTLTAQLVSDDIRLKAEQSTPSEIQIALHVQDNIATYQMRLDHAKRHPTTTIVKIKETENLLELWQTMQSKAYKDLSTEQKNELLDSMVSAGDFN